MFKQKMEEAQRKERRETQIETFIALVVGIFMGWVLFHG